MRALAFVIMTATSAAAGTFAPPEGCTQHLTVQMRGCLVSQFENHIRAVLGLPLGDTRMLGHACMLNWLGQMPDAKPVLAEAAGHWHDYGKQARDGRKVGHANLRDDAPAALADALSTAFCLLDRAGIESTLARFPDSRLEVACGNSTSQG